MAFNPLHTLYVSFPFIRRYFYPTSAAFLTWFPAFLPQFPKSSPWFSAFPTSPRWFTAFLPLFPIFWTWFPAFIPNILFTPFPDSLLRGLKIATENDILTSLETLSTSWRSSHRSALQRKQLFRISVLQTIKLSGFSISSKNIQEGVQF